MEEPIKSVEPKEEPKKSDRIRYALTLFVDKVELEPEVYINGAVRTAYDIELVEYDMKKMKGWIEKRLASPIITPLRVRIIGRLVSP